MPDHIIVRIENGREAQQWLDRNFSERSRSLRRFVGDLADYAEMWIRAYAPVGETKYLQAHIHKSPTVWRPGGAGGGGSWQAEAGIKRGTSKHPLYVHGGTGIWGPSGRPITARHDRAKASVTETRRPRRRWQDVETDPVTGDKDVSTVPALTFQKRGEPRRFRTWVRGQRPQPFVYLAYQQAKIYAVTRIGDVVRGVR